MRRIVDLALLLLIVLGTVTQASAQEAAPQGSTEGSAVLTVVPVGDPEIAFTLDDLKAIGATKLETGTPWTEGAQSFVGVTGKQLLAALKARGVAGAAVQILATANNDYSIALPVARFDADDLLIAYERNGAALPIRDKGPLWIVFPFDRDPKYLTNTYKSYSIWGLVRLELKAQ